MGPVLTGTERDYNPVAKISMADVEFIDKASFWINLAYAGAVLLALALSVIAVFLSNQRAALRDIELRKTEAQAQAQEQIASATHLLAQAQLTKENLQLSIELEREKRLRLEIEGRVAQHSPPLPADLQQTQGRAITGEQEALLLSALSSFGSRRAAMIELADQEAGALARQIRFVLEKAQWSIFVTRVGALAPPQQGIICSHSPGDQAASALVSTLRSFNMIVHERSEDVDQVQIIVGLKP